MSAGRLGGQAVREQPPFGAFAQGLLGAVAMGELTSGGGATVNGVVPVAIGMGIAAAVFAVAGDWLTGLSGWFYSALGIVAFVPAAVGFVRSNGCLPGPPPVLRFLAMLLLVAIAGVMMIASFLRARRTPRPAVGLALFGAVQILIAASTFIAGRASAENMLALAVMVVGAAFLGWFVVSASEVVSGVAGVAFGMNSIYAAAAGHGCSEANFSGAVLIIVFCGAYFATRAVCAPFGSRR